VVAGRASGQNCSCAPVNVTRYFGRHAQALDQGTLNLDVRTDDIGRLSLIPTATLVIDAIQKDGRNCSSASEKSHFVFYHILFVELINVCMQL